MKKLLGLMLVGMLGMLFCGTSTATDVSTSEDGLTVMEDSPDNVLVVEDVETMPVLNTVIVSDASPTYGGSYLVGLSAELLYADLDKTEVSANYGYCYTMSYKLKSTPYLTYSDVPLVIPLGYSV